MSMFFPKPNLSIATVATALLLSACSGGGAGEPDIQAANSGVFLQLPADTISRIGEVQFRSINGKAVETLGLSNGLYSGYAEFTDYGQVMSKAYIDATFSLADLNSCELWFDDQNSTQNPDADRDPALDAFEANYRSVAAGETLNISTPAGSWAEMVLDNEFDAYYEFDYDVSQLGNLPQGAMLSVIGGDFPAFDNIAIPAVERISSGSISNVVDLQLSAGSTVSWSMPTRSSANTFTTFYLSGEELDSRGYVDVFCTVADTGRFEFPENVKNLFSEYVFLTEDVVFSRVSVGTAVKGNAAVAVYNSAQFFF